jgi:mRNA-degrading endonuclease toxin of MazEF toxin-antitoxin module
MRRGEIYLLSKAAGDPKHASWIMCDNLISVRKTDLTRYLGSIPRTRAAELDHALKMALGL